MTSGMKKMKVKKDNIKKQREWVGGWVGFCFKKVVTEFPLLKNSEQGSTSKIDHFSLILANSRIAHFMDKLRKSPF